MPISWKLPSEFESTVMPNSGIEISAFSMPWFVAADRMNPFMPLMPVPLTYLNKLAKVNCFWMTNEKPRSLPTVNMDIRSL